MGKRGGQNLTTRGIDAIKASSKIRAYPDRTEGLELYVTPGGIKTFSFRYTLADGTRRRLNLGRYPAMSIDEARTAARAHSITLARGGDPASEKKRELHALRTRSVKTLADLTAALFQASEAAGVRTSTLTYWRWLEKKHVIPRLNYRLDELNAGLIRKAIRDIGEAAGPTTGNRAFGLLRRAFNFGVEEEHLAASPMSRMKALFAEGSRARVLTDSEIKTLWLAAEDTKALKPGTNHGLNNIGITHALGIAIQLCLITAQRGGEVIGMRACELDLTTKVWVLPQERTKAGREHLVPLTTHMVKLIEEASAIAAMRLGRPLGGDDPIFPTPRVGSAPRDARGGIIGSPKAVARLSLGRAVARLCETAGLKDLSAHDLRRTASTLMASERIGVLGEVIARILNHAPPGLGVTAVYNRHAYVSEKRLALEAWEALLLDIVDVQKRPSTVSNIREVTNQRALA